MSAEKSEAILPPPAVGFDVRLNGASLWDLVQMECQARVRRVFQVKGEGGVGFLYLAAGRVVHALTSHSSGEAAALEILEWANGSFQACERAWPPAPTIERSTEALILQAAVRRDEQHTSNLLAFPGRAPSDAPAEAEIEEVEIEEIQEINQEGADMRSTIEQPPETAPAPGPRGELAVEFPVMLRLTAGGEIVKNQGASEETAEAVAYAQRLVQLAGELLGLDTFHAMECAFTDGRFFMFTESSGDLVALRPRADANLQPLRERLGL